MQNFINLRFKLSEVFLIFTQSGRLLAMHALNADEIFQLKKLE